MASRCFRDHLTSLESEYCRLEAENLHLRQRLTGNASGSDLHDDKEEVTDDVVLCRHFELHSSDVAMDAESSPKELSTSDAEVSLSKPRFFQHAAEHCMAPEMTPDIEKTSPRPSQCTMEDEDVELKAAGEASGNGSCESITANIQGTVRSRATQFVPSFMMPANRPVSPSITEQLEERRKSLGAGHSTEVLNHKAMFIDPEEFKMRVRAQLMKKQYDVTIYYKDSGGPQYIARHQYFEIVTLIVIGANAVWIAIDTDYNKASLLVDADIGFQLMEHVFCTYFTLELMIRFLSFKWKGNCFMDPWFVFDASLVTMMVLETWVMSIIIKVSAGGRAVDLGNVSVLRIARLMRLTRMARMARLLRAVPELMILIKGMLAAARSVGFTLVLLLILLYVFAIAFTQLLADTDAGSVYFAKVPNSMQTLWLYATLLEEITTLTHDLEKESIWIVFLLDLYILAASLTVMNMLIGVLCEVVSAVASSEKEEVAFNFVKAKVERIFYNLGLDDDRNGMISRQEFVKIVENREAARAISELGVDVAQLVDLVDFFFEEENHIGDMEEKELSFAEFMDILAQLRGRNFATVKDMMLMKKFLKIEIIKLRSAIGLRDNIATLGALTSPKAVLEDDVTLRACGNVLSPSNGAMKSTSIPGMASHHED